ncbi:CocE/NonD family hydrolase [Gordonia sp. HY002]|uniref:CocE/NonD family hydrolase n=1 Tax=Gordonia zhenghanii TaxID=2911516 RepID=UPI001EF04E27|nr:CocE/NonD family hydrolase [Gordonia zhenghanii]MCF8572282.1 CocE/NonD family hydrolase [Gordonia zhenghanii]MCF8606011.1 CocE/NonD family hydrolase [Gordonia zhenghanii]
MIGKVALCGCPFEFCQIRGEEVSGIIRFVSVVVVTVLTVTLGFIAPPVQADSVGIGLSNPGWIKTHNSPRQRHGGISLSTSVPIRMSDGTVLRADVYRPADRVGRAAREKMPVIVSMTPYSKLVTMIAAVGGNIPGISRPLFNLLGSISLHGTPISGTERLLKLAKGGIPSLFSVDPQLVRSGYTQVVVDVRGTGASQGVWDVFGPREQKDTLEVLKWARTRSYSDGDLGMSGYSYSAINQLQAASERPKGLKAIFPAAPMTDIVADVVAPGSGYGAGFLALWLFLVNSTKVVPDLPRLLRGQFDPKWLADRINHPIVFVPEYLQGLTTPSVGDLRGRTKEIVQLQSRYRKALTTDAARVQVPTFVLGGWQDLFTNMEWRALDQLSGVPADRKKLVMSTGQHVTNGWDMGSRNEP